MSEGNKSIWKNFLRAPVVAAAAFGVASCGETAGTDNRITATVEPVHGRFVQDTAEPTPEVRQQPTDEEAATTPEVETLTCSPVAVSNIPSRFNGQNIRFVVLERQEGMSWGVNGDCLLRNNQWQGLSAETSAYLTQEARTNFQETDNAAPNGWTVNSTHEALIANGAANFALPPVAEVGNSFLICAILPDASWRCVLRMPNNSAVNDQINFGN